MNYRSLLVSCIALLPAVAFAQDYSQDSVFIKQVSNNVFENRFIYDNLYFLTKKIGNRLAGSPNMGKAEQWGKQALQNAGADNVWLQPCKVTHWERGGKDEAVIFFKNETGKPEQRSINVLALGNTDGSGAKGVRGNLIRVNSFDELEEQKDNLKGKIVFYNCPFDDTLIRTFEAYGKNVVYRGHGASRAARYGAVGVIIRSMTNAYDNAPHTGAQDYAKDVTHIPALAVGMQDVAYLNSLFDKGIAIDAKIVTNGKMYPDTTAHNVIGELKGTEHPDEYITVGGHLDSWDVGEGASDDGTGIVQTIEILRAFKALRFKPKHTIRFVLFANEENGDGGGRQYAQDAAAKNEKHIFIFESDAGGFTPRGFGTEGVSEKGKKMFEVWSPIFKPYGVEEWGHGGGTDISPTHKKLNIPMGEFIPDSQRYFDLHHSINDTFEKVSPREMKLGAINIAGLIYMIDKYGL
ncbi:MAG: M20/M25/M40 family metallo-hydrolase [Chitinophagaceae bacterium]|jgi:hypothetical protein|nr:M20/M25/M40 family metallo-hydrolase [Chitinophagaceae bacterium]